MTVAFLFANNAKKKLGGIDSFLTKMARAIKEMGGDARVYASWWYHWYIQKRYGIPFEPEEYTVYLKSWVPLDSAFGYLIGWSPIGSKLKDELRKFEPNVINIHAMWPFGYTRYYDAPHVVTFHMLSDILCSRSDPLKMGKVECKKPPSILRCWLCSLEAGLPPQLHLLWKGRESMASLIDGGIAYSNWIIEKVRTFGYNGPIRRVNLGVTTDESVRSLDKFEEPTAIFLGKLHHRKRIIELLEAAKDVPSVKLLVVGGGNLLDEVRSKYGRYEHIRITGPLVGREKWELLRRSWVLVNPSKMENTPAVLLEAYSVGTLVAMPPIGGIPEYAGEELIPLNLKVETGPEESIEELRRFFEDMRGWDLSSIKSKESELIETYESKYRWVDFIKSYYDALISFT